MVKILFIDPEGTFIEWIKYYFKDIDDIQCKKISVEQHKPQPNERVVYMSPLNNMGLMNNGIDMAYNYIMFKHINISVKKRLIEIHNLLSKNTTAINCIPPEILNSQPYLSVGSAMLIPIEGTTHYLIGSPTLSYNNLYNDSEKNAYYAFKACFKLVNYYLSVFGNNKMDMLVIPSLCCGSSKVSPKEAARQIFNAYFDCRMGFDKDKPIFISPSFYIFKTNEYMTYEKLLQANKENAKYLGVQLNI